MELVNKIFDQLDELGKCMPKIVDHTAYRAQLARQAAALFSRHGYSGLGMRQIAAELGVSKSALYHYFPTKNDLFAACTEVVTQDAEEQAKVFAGLGKDTADEDRIAALSNLFDELAPVFAGEVSLLMDYLRDREPDDIAADSSLQLANRRYRELFVALVGENHAAAVYCLLIGALLQRQFDGGQTSFSDIESSLQAILSSGKKC